MDQHNTKPMHMVTKRRNPFGENFSRMTKTANVDPAAIEETRARTHHLLMNANPNQITRTGSLHMATPSVHKCWVCSVMSECAECAFCERETCERCQRQCEGCLESFCSLCSTTNYDEKYDRTFCLDCNEEVRRSSPNRKPVTGFSQLPTPVQQPYFRQLQYNFQ